MMWAGLALGIVVGAVLWNLPGAVILGFIGWLAGVIVDSKRAAARRPAEAPPRPLLGEPLPVRLDRMERTLASLEARMGRIEAAVLAAPWGAAVPVAKEEVVAPVVEAAAPMVQEAPAPVVETAVEDKKADVAPNPLVAWLTGGNAIARAGLLILFFGLAFLLKYMADRNLISPELRVGGIAAAGIAMLVIGWRLRERRRAYALGLQGGGVAVLYLVTFAALKLYHLLDPGMAFALLAAIAALSAFIAIAEDSAILAAFGAGGGFLAPILASTGGGSHVALFSYYVILNAGILAIAFFKAWRGLNVMGFLFTFVIGLAWGMKYYQPEYLGTTEPFLIVFFLMYVAMAVLFARRGGSDVGRYLDAILLFGVPIAAFGLQAALMRDTEFGLAFSAVALAAFYVLLGMVLRRGARWAPVVEVFVSLGVVFATVAIPLALDARWTSAAWALEGAAVFTFGVRQGRVRARLFGLAVQLAAGISFVIAYPGLYADVPLVDAVFVGALLVAAAGSWTARRIARAVHPLYPAEKAMEAAAYIWAVGWWLFAWHHEIRAFVPFEMRLPASVALLAATALGTSFLSIRLAWPIAAAPTLALLPALIPCLLLGMIGAPHPFAHFGWAAWIAALAVQVWVLRRHADAAPEGYDSVLHAGTALVVAVLGAVELHWLAVEYTARGTAWSIAAVMVVPAIVAIVIASASMDERWPVSAYPRSYRNAALGAILAALAVWVVYANVTHDGRSDPLPYIPFVNALDLGHVLAILGGVFAWLGFRRRPGEFPAAMGAPPAAAAASALAFLWLNGILLRSIHHWSTIPYAFEPMMRSVVVQAALSIFWSVLALTLMVLATRTGRRAIWMTGAVLMVVVAAKLFVVDLSHVSGVERIVSFIGVGLLMLVVGYVAPVPPRHKEAVA